MNKKELIAPVLIIGLSILFATVCFMVIITKNKSPKWIARKMKIGALLLTLNTFASVSAQEVEVTCYDPVPEPNMMEIVTSGMNVTFSKNQQKVLKLEIYDRQGIDFSYTLANNKGTVIKKGTILPADGEFDEINENCQIKFDNTLKKGKYLLTLYDCSVTKQRISRIRNKVKIEVTK